jgi:hypothetical protein
MESAHEDQYIQYADSEQSMPKLTASLYLGGAKALELR